MQILNGLKGQVYIMRISLSSQINFTMGAAEVKIMLGFQILDGNKKRSLQTKTALNG